MKVRKVFHFLPLLLIKLVEQANWEQGRVLGWARDYFSSRIIGQLPKTVKKRKKK